MRFTFTAAGIVSENLYAIQEEELAHQLCNPSGDKNINLTHLVSYPRTT